MDELPNFLVLRPGLLLIPIWTPQTLTLLLSFLYCTGVPTPFEVYGVGGGRVLGFVGRFVCLFVCSFVLGVFFFLANWCIFRYHLSRVDLSPDHHGKCLPDSIF